MAAPALFTRIEKLLLENGWEKTWEDPGGQRWEKDSDAHYWRYWQLTINFMPDGNHYCKLYYGSSLKEPETTCHLRSLRPVLKHRRLIR
ncbi:MAG: hypothetical protein C4542_08515 [Dehalococcoidia bacterium]|nr:MAG: hypothetical protein C4542_08515 [Dehalococcoidia bacterium]